LHNKIFSVEHPRLQVHKSIKHIPFIGKKTHKINPKKQKIKEEKNGLRIKDPTPL
jgi:hypothetical protein